MNLENIQNINQYTINNDNLLKYYEQFPVTTTYETIIGEPIITQTETNYITKPATYYTYNTQNDNINYPIMNDKNKTKNNYVFSPERKNMKKTQTNNNYEEYENIITYQSSTNANSPYSNTNLSGIIQNKNNRSRSPGITRTNNFLKNNEELNSIPSFYSRSPGTSRNYKIISTSSLKITPTNTRKNINLQTNPVYYYNNYQSPNSNTFYNSESTLLNANNSNNSYLEIINSNPSDHNVIYSIPNNSSSNNMLNNFSSQTYSGNKNSSLYTNYIVTPTKNNNEIHYISYPFNSIQTVPDTNQYLKTYSTSPNNININTFPSSSDKLLSNNYHNITSIPTIETKYASKTIPYNQVNQNQALTNPSNYLQNQNVNTLQNQVSSKKITNFPKNVNKKRKKLESCSSISPSSISSIKKENHNSGKKTKHLKKKSEQSSSESEKSNKIKSLLYSKVKNYFEPSSGGDSNDDEEEENESDDKSQNSNKFIKRKNHDNYKNNMRIKSDEYFSRYMFININKIRENPKDFIQTIRKGMENISYDRRGQLIYKGKLKVALSKGEIAFKEAIAYLENIQPMKPLIFKKDLCVDISNDETEFTSGDYLRNQINDKIDNEIPIRAFWRDIIKDPEINLLLMIVDDNPIRRGNKRKDILDPKMKYIGISSGSLGNNFVSYTVLSDE